MRLFDVPETKDVEDLLTRGEEIVRDDAAMASPPDCLGAHDRGGRRMTKPAQFFEARAEFLAHGVVGIVVKARVLPEGVDVRHHPRLLSTKSSKSREMLIGDSMRSEIGEQRVAVELRVGPRARNRPDVDDELNSCGLKERDETFGWAGRMSDGEEWVSHGLEYTLLPCTARGPASAPPWTDDQLKAIDTPILVVDGDHDEAIKRPRTEHIAATVPPAGLLILPNASDFAILHFLGDE